VPPSDPVPRLLRRPLSPLGVLARHIRLFWSERFRPPAAHSFPLQTETVDQRRGVRSVLWDLCRVVSCLPVGACDDPKARRKCVVVDRFAMSRLRDAQRSRRTQDPVEIAVMPPDMEYEKDRHRQGCRERGYQRFQGSNSALGRADNEICHAGTSGAEA
jgi:hypothetical protein